MWADAETPFAAVDRPTGPEPLAANATWLVLLRWVAVVGQMLTIGVARFGLRMPLSVWPLIAVVGVTAVTNLMFSVWSSRLRHRGRSPSHAATAQRIVASVMTLDILALTVLLYFSGGTANPFFVFYLVNLALGAVLLSERWGWILTSVAVLGMSVLLLSDADRPELFAGRHWLRSEWLSSVTLGQFARIAAVAGCALVIIHFVARVTHQLELTAAELRRVERVRLRSEKLEALGTLAGGAAHELATPLSTIAVVAKEMIRSLQEVNVPEAVRDDVMLIRGEVDHCQTILQRMTGRAGRWMAEEHERLDLGELVTVTLAELAHADHIHVSLPAGSDQVSLSVPRESLAQALRGLLQNALDATPDEEAVEWSVRWDLHHVEMMIQDRGPGMTAEVLSRAGEPFFTTKDPGRGMGLGLFLTRSVIERLGGALRIDSTPGQGVTAVVRLPLK
jgi:two-component system sensor histidine kinase RegB